VGMAQGCWPRQLPVAPAPDPGLETRIESWESRCVSLWRAIALPRSRGALPTIASRRGESVAPDRGRHIFILSAYRDGGALHARNRKGIVVSMKHSRSLSVQLNHEQIAWVRTSADRV
jgi:hypothetical protein